jgi:hypothetical protein
LLKWTLAGDYFGTPGGRVENVRYISHQFAHIETLQRARRWLVQNGIEPSRIEVHTDGIPRLAVAVDAGQFAEVELLISTAESGDPDGNPSFWDLARQKHVYPEPQEPGASTQPETRSESFVIGWRPLDSDREVTQATTETEIELQKAYREGRD